MVASLVETAVVADTKSVNQELNAKQNEHCFKKSGAVPVPLNNFMAGVVSSGARTMSHDEPRSL